MDEALRQALFEGRAGREEPVVAPGTKIDALMHAKLWDNPCWFSFRLNYLALHFNNPVYSYIQQHLGLLRPEFVVLWSLYLGGSSTLTDVVRSSGFPKNTLSRAANKLTRLGMIDRAIDQDDQRRITLDLTGKGREAVEFAKGMMIEHERRMLECLSPAERLSLSEIMTKLVTASGQWPQMIDNDQSDDAL
ncbi:MULTISPECIES: MarR family winged helix-turn-helix transcriptional regulator [Shinella]|jgi:DNA-binding MarR family transcriptional regulator|uniref:DNA-binding MarR family transcriptional regulator n=1 Tax=Shinella granuli TaxID=323621 RepID=A0A4R2CVQ2_SHIGR|nr:MULTISPECIES: MarR family winged helix-turn-helix transcriptional regulator [Shinella]TCN43774.1 DNA-binding MarR family transcriptional regulator [Shinella granuli]